jgi:putative transcriptional regulator
VAEKLTNQIRHLRRGFTDMTQQGLADAVGCTRQTIIALEQEKYNPSLILAMKITEVLGRKIEEVFMIESESE